MFGKHLKLPETPFRGDDPPHTKVERWAPAEAPSPAAPHDQEVAALAAEAQALADEVFTCLPIEVIREAAAANAAATELGRELSDLNQELIDLQDDPVDISIDELSRRIARRTVLGRYLPGLQQRKREADERAMELIQGVRMGLSTLWGVQIVERERREQRADELHIEELQKQLAHRRAVFAMMETQLKRWMPPPVPPVEV